VAACHGVACVLCAVQNETESGGYKNDNQRMHMYSHVQSDIFIINHQHVEVPPVTIISLSLKNNTINIKIILLKCMTKPLAIALVLDLK
jgi:hypothetical protein